ncbi:Cullin [Chytriomyces sp. MP71]|nr:Cullin [Chytriomyces sp. MP71]
MSLRPKRIDFPSTMASLQTHVSRLFRSIDAGDEGDTRSFMDPFQCVYDLCTAFPKPFDEALFDAIARFLGEYAATVAERIALSQDLVSAYATEWTHYRHAAAYLDKICEYLNRIIAKKRGGLPAAAASATARRIGGNGGLAGASGMGGGPPKKFEKQRIEALAFLVWKEFVIVYIRQAHSNRLLEQVFDFVKHDRDGTPVVDNGVVINAVESFVQVCEYVPQQLAFYIDEFEEPYIKSTRAYYIAESNHLISTLDTSSFLKQVLERIEAEQARSSRFVHPTSREKVLKECEAQCITAHKERILGEFQGMLQVERLSDCTLVYLLMQRIADGIEPMLAIVQKHVFALGQDVVERLRPAAQKDPRELIQALIELHGKWSAICAKCFGGNPAFGAALDKAFRQIVNESYENAAQSFPELLSRFTDSLLKKTLKSQWTEAELEDKIAQALVLFKYLQEKDVFQKFYSRMLGKRLLNSLSASDDLEMLMISGLKTVCGVEYTSKLQRMFTDITLSNDLNKRFGAAMERSNVALGVDFSIYVLTAGSWPSMPGTMDFEMPDELVNSVTRFTDFYTSSHSGRKLTWMYHLCKADVRLTFCDKKYELNLSLHQLSVLLHFNETTNLSVTRIAELCKMKTTEVKKTIKPLVDLEVLNASSSSLDSSTDISVNLKFTNKRTKLKVAMASHSETVAQESQVTRIAVDEDRKLFLQATIVRLLKSRRLLIHNQLIQEVIQLSTARFVPSVALIKKSIEQLIEKGYMERSSEKKDTYIYLA